MARRVITILLLAGAIASLGVFVFRGFAKEQDLGKEGDITIISERIDEILKNQQDIITRLKDIREELDIIRVRASRK